MATFRNRRLIDHLAYAFRKQEQELGQDIKSWACPQ